MADDIDDYIATRGKDEQELVIRSIVTERTPEGRENRHGYRIGQLEPAPLQQRYSPMEERLRAMACQALGVTGRSPEEPYDARVEDVVAKAYQHFRDERERPELEAELRLFHAHSPKPAGWARVRGAIDAISGLTRQAKISWAVWAFYQIAVPAALITIYAHHDEKPAHAAKQEAPSDDPERPSPPERYGLPTDARRRAFVYSARHKL